MAVDVAGTPIEEFDHDPEAVLDYGLKLADWLKGDTLSASSWFVPSGITEALPAPSFTNTITTIWISGGTPGQFYDLINSITTAAGRKDDRTIRLNAKER